MASLALSALLALGAPALAQETSASSWSRLSVGLERAALSHASGREIEARQGTSLVVGWRIAKYAEVQALGAWFDSPAADASETLMHVGLLLRAQGYRLGPIEPYAELGMISHRRTRDLVYLRPSRFSGSATVIGAGVAVRVLPAVALQAGAQFHDGSSRGSVDVPPGSPDPGYYLPHHGSMRNFIVKGGVVWRR